MSHVLPDFIESVNVVCCEPMSCLLVFKRKLRFHGKSTCTMCLSQNTATAHGLFRHSSSYSDSSQRIDFASSSQLPADLLRGSLSPLQSRRSTSRHSYQLISRIFGTHNQCLKQLNSNRRLQWSHWHEKLILPSPLPLSNSLSNCT